MIWDHFVGVGGSPCELVYQPRGQGQHKFFSRLPAHLLMGDG
jgi:hypothetical protein